MLFHKPHFRIPVLNPGERLHEPCEHVATLRQSHLLARTYALAGGEGHVLAHRRLQRRVLPSLRPELRGVSAPDIRVSLCEQEHHVDLGAFTDIDGGGAVGAAAGGEGCVDGAAADVHAEGRDEAEALDGSV